MTINLTAQDTLTVGTLPGATIPSFAPTLASLPVSFLPAVGGFADVTVIGGGTDWPLAVADAIRAGSQGIIVSNPGMADPAVVLFAADLAEEHNAHVVLAEPYAGDPGLLAHQTDIVNHMAAVDTLSIKEVSVHGDAGNLLLSVLRTARAIGYPSPRLDSYVPTDHGFTAGGTAANGAVFAALGVQSPAAPAGQSVRGYGFARTVAVDLFGAKTASPASLSITNVDGELSLTSVYETADRAAWLQLKNLLDTHETQSHHVLRDFVADIETVSAA